ncbi:type II toxin-antitoxin system HicB family antitoxin [Anaerolineae bacterium CFX7]|nr:type II toxin-antitoxin system HicB family antitoxin [Anaerolineae bacterium CFX7]
MNQVLQLTAIIEREDDGYVSTCPELDIVSQGDTVEQARMNLLEAVEGFFQVASQSEIQRRLKKETYVTPIMPTVPIIKSKKAARVKDAKAA